jgi:predicted nucleotidyltransferase
MVADFVNMKTSLPVRNRCDPERIDPRYAPLIDDAIAAYTRIFTDRIIDIRLQGSVARGEAVVGQSDIDFMAILSEEPRGDEVNHLREFAAALGRRYPIVSRVELDAGTLAGLSDFQRFALSSDSLSLYGQDHLTRRVQHVERTTLARLVTPDMAGLIRDYRAWVGELAEEPDEDALAFASRIIGKDLLKGLRYIALLRGGPYQVNIKAIHRRAAIDVPELTGLADRLLALYRMPVVEPAILLGVIDEAEASLLPAMRAAASEGTDQ